MAISATWAPRRIGAGTRPARASVTIAVIAAMPVLLVLSGWDPSLGSAALATFRSFGIAIMAAQGIVIAIALSAGWNARRDVAMAPRTVRWSLLALMAIALFTAVAVATSRPSALLRTDGTLLHLAFGLALLHLAKGWDDATRARLWPAVAIGLLLYVALIPVYLAAIPQPETFEWIVFGYAGNNVRHVGYFVAIG